MTFQSEIPPPPPADYFLAADNPDFTQVAHAPIWRYIDIAKLVSLLDKQALYFARLDKLGDPFEGSITRQRQLRRLQINGLHRDSQTLVESIIVNTIVNCWHANEGESFAMWRLYAPNNQGVALRSTYGQLVASFPAFKGDTPSMPEGLWARQLFVRIGMVKYIDFDSYEEPDDQIYFLKRLSFEHERELRAVVEDDLSFMGDPHAQHPRFPSGGDYVPVDLTTLVSEIYVPPGAPGWFKSVVQSIVHRYDYDFPIKQSELDRPPIR